MDSLRPYPVRRFASESGARDRAAQAGPIIRLCARLIFAYCCQPRHLLRLDLPDKSSDQQLDLPKNWNALRIQWEYSHAANAVVTFAALVCVVIAVLRQPSQAR
jgi:hypothetical protein